LAITPGGGCGVWDGAVRCWTGDEAPRHVTANASTLAFGFDGRVCMISADRRLSCWHDGTVERPTEPLPDARVAAVALGAHHLCAALEAREVRCIGADDRGQAARQKAVLAGEAVVSIAAGDAHTCAKTDRGVYCWGANDAGQLGDGTTNDAHAPVLVHGVDAAVELGAGARHTCARLANKTIACWGANDAHQLADGTMTPSSRPVTVFGLVGVARLAVAGDAACVLLSDDAVRCWGRNDTGQLGDGTTETRNVPSAIKTTWPR
jgi:alpha-tubulin suppressor-like RCC1 family protein